MLYGSGDNLLGPKEGFLILLIYHKYYNLKQNVQLLNEINLGRKLFCRPKQGLENG